MHTAWFRAAWAFTSITLVLVPPLAASLSGQLVPITTVPLATGDQFLTTPSDRFGMAGLRLAVDDTLGGPFRNPATAARIPESVLFGAPVYYGISGRNGSGRTLPLGGIFRSGRFFAGGAFALQQLAAGDDDIAFFDACLGCWPPPQRTLREQSGRNLYANGLVGARLGGGGGLSLGASASYAGLDWIGGVEHLYVGSQRIEPSGSVVDLRLGLLNEPGDGSSLALVVLHQRVDMTHDVTWRDWPWAPRTEVPIPEWRVERNEDQTNTWGGHLAYSRPVGEVGWRVGWSVTGNRREHPKIPNYSIQNIPRDPGESWAFDFGVGVARHMSDVVFGVDLHLLPIWADTWQEAEGPVTGAGGLRIPKGGKTIENAFTFTNVTLRTGLEQSIGPAALQLGLEARSIGYDLEQFDNLAGVRRDQSESWVEWTPTWGGRLKLDNVELRYGGRLTTGTGQPGVDARVMPAADEALTTVLIAPSGPLTLQDAHVWTHQLTVVIPMG